MGTLFNQPARKQYNYNLDDEIQNFKDIAKQNNISYGELLDTIKILELKRKNDLFVANGDILDEQLAGFGQLLDNK